MKNKEIKLKDVIDYIQKNNNNKSKYYHLDYLLEENCISKEWYEAILEKVLKHKPKRVIDVGCCLGIFGYLFANKGIEYIGIDIDDYKRFETEKIKFIHANYHDVKEQFKDDIIISCLCVGYLIPIKDALGKMLIMNDSKGKGKQYKCTAKEIKLGGKQ